MNNDTLKCKGKIEKVHYDEKINLLELNKETTVLPLKKNILDKYFNHENLSSRNSLSIKSLGYISPKHAVDVHSDIYSLEHSGSKNSVRDTSDNYKCYSLGYINPEHAVDVQSDIHNSKHLSSKNTVIDTSDNYKPISLGYIKPKHAIDVHSDTNNLGYSSSKCTESQISDNEWFRVLRH